MFSLSLLPFRSLIALCFPISPLSSLSFFADPWERVLREELTRAEQKHILKAWSVPPSERHIDFLLSDQNLHDIGFIPILSEERRRISETNLEKKSECRFVLPFLGI